MFGSSAGADARRLGYVTQLGNGRVRRSLGTDIETGRHHHLPCQLTCRYQAAAPTGSLGISTAYRRVLYRPRAKTHTSVMGRYLPIIIIGLLMIYCVVEVAQAPPFAVRRMPRWLWATAIICLPLAGAVCWLLLGRPTAESSGTKQKPRPKAPDDDIDFLRGL